jgi:hypothetical protein
VSISHNFELAPEPKNIDGLSAVPIDIQQLDAHVIFDLHVHKAKVEATIDFVVGPDEGNPFFDLRQDIDSAYINDEQIPINKLRHHDFKGGDNSELRILEKVLSANSRNKLRLDYELSKPQSHFSRPIGWDNDRLYFEFWFSDLYSARYLEMWFPSNLIFDQFASSIDIEIINTKILHKAFSNGQVDVLDQNHWNLKYPNTFTSLSPMLCIVAEDIIDYRQGTMILPDTGNQIQLDTFKLSNTTDDLAIVENNVMENIANNVMNVGPYIHGDRFTTFIWSDTGRSGMEYDGATTTELAVLKHEVFHSWFARGLKPASQNDAWMDEGWTVYNTEDISRIRPFDMSEPPLVLSSSNLFNRITPNSRTSPDAYKDGSRFFATLAAEVGLKELVTYMNKFYEKYKGLSVTTKQLQCHLIKESDNNKINRYFDRFVYGLT